LFLCKVESKRYGAAIFTEVDKKCLVTRFSVVGDAKVGAVSSDVVTAAKMILSK
jgi:hypothetical protein